eukprot:gene8119-5655_t
MPTQLTHTEDPSLLFPPPASMCPTAPMHHNSMSNAALSLSLPLSLHRLSRSSSSSSIRTPQDSQALRMKLVRKISLPVFPLNFESL